jgi:Got1/Sft2-like family
MLGLASPFKLQIGYSHVISLDMIAFFSFRFFVELVEGYPVPFALNYTFGHILQLLASTFLCGPKVQFK